MELSISLSYFYRVRSILTILNCRVRSHSVQGLSADRVYMMQALPADMPNMHANSLKLQDKPTVGRAPPPVPVSSFPDSSFHTHRAQQT